MLPSFKFTMMMVRWICCGYHDFLTTGFISLIPDADIGFTSSHFTVRENDSEVNIQVGVLSGLLQKEVTIKLFITELNTFGNTMSYLISFYNRFFYIAGEDYHKPQSLELTLNFTTSVQISIPIINDDIFELTESFLMNLSLIGGLSSQNSTRVLILDDDGTACECQIHNVQE